MVDVSSLWSKTLRSYEKSRHFLKANHYTDFFVYFDAESCCGLWLAGENVQKPKQKYDYNSNKDLRYEMHAVYTRMCVTRVLMDVLKIAVIYAKLASDGQCNNVRVVHAIYAHVYRRKYYCTGALIVAVVNRVQSIK